MLYGVIISFYSSSAVLPRSILHMTERMGSGEEVAFEWLHFKAQISRTIKLKQSAITKVFSAALYLVAKT